MELKEEMNVQEYCVETFFILEESSDSCYSVGVCSVNLRISDKALTFSFEFEMKRY